MAVWQYDIALVPRTGVIRHHESIPDELPGYRAVWHPEKGTDEALPNYWAGREPPESFAVELGGIMATRASWSKNALMFGHEDGNSIQIWLGESLNIRLDLRNIDLDLVRTVVNFAVSHDLLWVSDTLGRPIHPDFQAVVQDIQVSDAYRFCKDPEGYLKTLPKKGGNEVASK